MVQAHIQMRERDVGHTCHSTEHWMDHKDNFFTTANVWVRISKLAGFFSERIPCQFCRGFLAFSHGSSVWLLGTVSLSIGYPPCGAPRWLQKDHGIFDPQTLECPGKTMMKSIHLLEGPRRYWNSERRTVFLFFFWVFSKALFWTKLVIFWKPGRELGWRRLASAFASHQC